MAIEWKIEYDNPESAKVEALRRIAEKLDRITEELPRLTASIETIHEWWASQVRRGE